MQDESSNNDEPINAELLKEKLREQFMSDAEAEQQEMEADEYTIDSDLISEFYEEVQNTDDIAQEVEELVQDKEEPQTSDEAQDVVEEDETAESEALTYEPQEGEIVEIAIPWVENIEEQISKEEIEDFGGELNEDYFDEEASENSYVCFADTEAIDDEMFEQNEEIEDEEDGEYDLPWYEELTDEPEEKITIEESLSEEHLNNIILPIDIDEYDEEEDEIDLFMDEEEEDIRISTDGKVNIEESEQIDIDDILVPESEENAVEDQKPYSLFEKSEPSTSVPEESEEEDSSFYRMMIDARTERENAYGYFSENTEDASDEQQVLGETVEDIDIPEFNYTPYVSVDLSNTSNTAPEGEEESGDFYGTDEHAASTDDDNVGDGMPVFDYDHEEMHSETFEENHTNILWVRVKPILMAAITLAILILELLPILGIVPDGIFDYTSYPWTYIFIDAQLLVFAEAICYKKLLDGFF